MAVNEERRGIYTRRGINKWTNFDPDPDQSVCGLCKGWGRRSVFDAVKRLAVDALCERCDGTGVVSNSAKREAPV